MAPASRARSTSSRCENAVRITTGATCSPTISAAASIPSFLGIFTSRITRSGRSSSARATACSPSAASPTTSKPSSASISARSSLINASSSAMRTRRGAVIGHLPNLTAADRPWSGARLTVLCDPRATSHVRWNVTLIQGTHRNRHRCRTYVEFRPRGFPHLVTFAACADVRRRVADWVPPPVRIGGGCDTDSSSLPPYPNRQRKRTQNPHSVSSSLTGGTRTSAPPRHGFQQIDESGTNRGRLRGLVLPVGGVVEVGVPALVVVGKGVVEYPGADLQ